MNRLSRYFAATLMAFFMSLAFAPAHAAMPPAGPALAVEAGSRATDKVQYYGHRRVYRAPRYARPYGYRPYYARPYRYRPYYARPRFYGGPVYYGRPAYRRCVTRPRWVWTPYGQVRRWVRVCR